MPQTKPDLVYAKTLCAPFPLTMPHKKEKKNNSKTPDLMQGNKIALSMLTLPPNYCTKKGNARQPRNPADNHLTPPPPPPVPRIRRRDVPSREVAAKKMRVLLLSGTDEMWVRRVGTGEAV